MPIHDYKCRECGSVSEVFLRNESSQVPPCPSCGSTDLEKLISASYTIMKDGTSPGTTLGEGASPGTTCCGRTERCDTPPCSTDRGCHRR